MARPTGTWARAELTVLLLTLAVFSCGRQDGSRAYQHAWKAYLSGDLAGAEAEARRGAASWRPDVADPWVWSFRLLLAETLNAQAKTEECRKLLATPVPDRPELRQAEVRRLIDSLGFADSQEAASRMLASIHASVTDPELAIRAALGDGVFALNWQNSAVAEKPFRHAWELAVAQDRPFWQSLALANLSYCAKSLGHYEEAIEQGLKARAAGERAGARRAIASADGNLGPVYTYLGDFEAAHLREEAAVRMFEAIGARGDLSLALGELGLLDDMEGYSAKAVPQYRRAYEIAHQLKHNRDVARFANNLALALMKTQQWEQAAEWNQRAGELSTGADPYRERNRARIAFGQGHSDEATSICQELLRSYPDNPGIRWSVYDLLGEIDAGKRDYAKANREFESALGIIEGSRTAVLREDNRVTILSRLMPFYQKYVDVLVEQKNDAAALRVIESSRARVLAERLGRDSQPQKASPERPANTAVLSFWIAPKRSFAWLATNAGTQRFDLPGGAVVARLVADYLAVVEHSVWDPLAADHPAAHALWDQLMTGIAPKIPRNSRLIVIPDGPLHRLNLETLIAPTPQPHYWLEDVEASIAPSLGLAGVPAAAKGLPSLLVLGAPDYTGTNYPPLAGAAREVAQIRARFAAAPATVLTGAQATPEAYRMSPAQFSLIHFAAHAEANSEKPLESAVVLSRGSGPYKLYARDVVGIPIRADLVTLSACHGAGSRAYGGEGLMGFAWAFMQAGARAVVAGLWDASDDATSLLMDQFYAHLAAGEDASAALHAAKLLLLHDGGRYSKPFYWGPFQLYARH